MHEDTHELTRLLQEQERDQVTERKPLPPPDRPTVHYSELPEDRSGSPNAIEWNFYRRQVGQLLAQGHEGKWVLIRGEQIIGIWDTEQQADRVRVERYLTQPVLIHQVRSREPVLRTPLWFHACRS